MSELWKYFTNLFKIAEKSSAKQAFIHEVIQRTEAEKSDYEFWKKTFVKRQLVDWLNNQYSRYLMDANDIDEAIDFLNTTSSKGFVLHFKKMGYNKTEIIHFFDFLKERVLTLAYRSYTSDFRSYYKDNQVETTQRHYLKPRINFQSTTGQPSNQLFGNINIELLLRNEEPIQLKFSATSYNDRKFKKADHFEALMERLLIHH